MKNSALSLLINCTTTKKRRLYFEKNAFTCRYSTTFVRKGSFCLDISNINDKEQCENLHKKINQHHPVFYLTNDQINFKKSIHYFNEEEISPIAYSTDEERLINPNLLNQLFQQGFMGIEIPINFGGVNKTLLESILVIEEIAKIDPSIAAIISNHNLLVNRLIISYATDEQKSLFLPKLAQDIIGTVLIPDESMDVNKINLSFNAVSDTSGGYKLNGSAFSALNIQESGIFVVFAYANSNQNSKMLSDNKELVIFLVEKSNSVGPIITDKVETSGSKTTSTCHITFNNFTLHPNSILANGLAAENILKAIHLLNKIGVCANLLGSIQGILNHTFNILKGDAGSDIHGNREDILNFFLLYSAEVKTEIEFLRLFLYNLSQSIGMSSESTDFSPIEQDNFHLKSAMCYLFASKLADKVKGKFYELMEMDGIKTDPLDKFSLNLEAIHLVEKTNDNIIQDIIKATQGDFN